VRHNGEEQENFTTRLKVTHANDINPVQWKHEVTETPPVSDKQKMGALPVRPIQAPREQWVNPYKKLQAEQQKANQEAALQQALNKDLSNRNIIQPSPNDSSN
jgi:hypothetical protein